MKKNIEYIEFMKQPPEKRKKVVENLIFSEQYVLLWNHSFMLPLEYVILIAFAVWWDTRCRYDILKIKNASWIPTLFISISKNDKNRDLDRR